MNEFTYSLTEINGEIYRYRVSLQASGYHFSETLAIVNSDGCITINHADDPVAEQHWIKRTHWVLSLKVYRGNRIQLKG